MKKLKSHYLFVIFIISLMFMTSCAETVVPDDYDNDDDDDDVVVLIPQIGSAESIEIFTWNIEHFPKSGTQTINRVAQVMDSVHADIYCVQEIENKSALNQVVAQLEGYEVIHDAGDFLNLAIVYNSEFIAHTSTELLFENDDYYFAGRPPLQVGFQAMTSDSTIYDFTVIDVHMKCCGSTSDMNRRHEASILLHNHLANKVANGDTNIFVLGDWNDDFTDPDSSGRFSFEPLLLDPDLGHFATWNLANSSSNFYDSYPSWPSFIDHIFLTHALFNEEANGEVKTLRLDDYFSDYDAVLSDHRPVGIIFEPVP